MIYFRDKTSKSTIGWRCVADHRCKARFITSLQYEQELSGKLKKEHFHMPMEEEIAFKKVCSEVKDKAVVTRDAPRALVTDAVASCSQEMLPCLPNKKSLSQQINRVRRKNYVQAVPDNFDDMEIPEEMTKTLDGDQFLIYDSRYNYSFLLQMLI